MSSTANVSIIREVTSTLGGSVGAEPILRVGCTASYNVAYPAWTTKESAPNISAKSPCSVWVPTPSSSPSEEWFIVSYYAQGNLGPPIGSATVVSVKNEDAKHPLVKAPTDWRWVWDDKKKESTNARVGFWWPVAPDGYISLGLVVSSGSGEKPTFPYYSYRCLREDLVKPTDIGVPIWDDKSSGAMHHVTIYSIVGLPNAFVGQGNYNPFSGTVYRIKD